jgi:hypothetical protein
LALLRGQPIAEAHSQLLHAFNTANASRQIGVRRPQSAASYASRRTAPRRRLTVPGAS